MSASAAAWRPAKLQVSPPVRGTTKDRPRQPIFETVEESGRPRRQHVGWAVNGKEVPCWDLDWRVDGRKFSRRFYRSGRAQAAKEQLERDFAAGLWFDPKRREFVAPPEAPDDRPTVFSELLPWWRAYWPTIEPDTRTGAFRAARRMLLHFIRSEPDAPNEISAYIEWLLLPPQPPEVPTPKEHEAAASWFGRSSMAVEDVAVADWQRFVEARRVNERNGKPVTPSSLTRAMAEPKQFWRHVCAVHGLADPFPAVRTGARSSQGSGRATQVDASLILSPGLVRELAELCGQGPFGPTAEAFVLLAGIGGGRPGEVLGVTLDDLALPTHGIGEVHFRRTSRQRIDPRTLDDEDDPDWGPLKRQELGAERTAPLPSRDARRLAELIVAQDGPLFATKADKPWDLDQLRSKVWEPAKLALAARHTPPPSATRTEVREATRLRTALEALRLHDLRHSACSMWLRTPGVPLKVAQTWSGHKQLSVFLNVYQGVMPSDEGSARRALEAAQGGR